MPKTPIKPTIQETKSGLVICRFNQHYEVESLNDTDQGAHYRCTSRSSLDALVPGDQVDWRAGTGGTGVIESRHERKNVLERPDNYGRIRPIAANIDQILITLAVKPTPQLSLIDRYLVAAHLLGAQPVIVLNKADLLTDENPLNSLLDIYRALDYQIIFTVCSKNQVLQNEQLIDLLQSQTSIVVGQSGVGKSSLVNAVLPEASQTIGSLSAGTEEGKHTTTHARLLHLPQSGRLIDSPGIRDFALWHISSSELQSGFIEIERASTACRFRNCQHNNEPGCAVIQAVKSGLITSLRLKSFTQIRETIAAQARGYR